MNIRKISERVYYVGVNDRVTEKFEGLWPLPNGVSYNSYLVKGDEKIALIDTVEESFHFDFLTNLEGILEGRTPDFLVVNHMEPDHSGGIPGIIERFPELKIIGNRQTIGMIKGFYYVDDSKFLEIQDNDVIDLGGESMRFVLTPMVHWPETMMTYLEQEKMIFSGDAFGTFGALNGGVIDEEMDTDIYFEEMYRYYSNIVGKYGKFVQKAMEKVSRLDINYICPTHGPVWHQKIKEAGSIYNKLSLYEAEEGVTVIYGSMYGNTARIAEAIATRLCERGIKKIRVHNASKSEMSNMISDAFRYKGLIVGGPTYSMRMFPPIETFMNAMETREIKNRVIATFGSFTWASAALSKLNDTVQRLKEETVASIDIKQSPTSKDFEAARDLADKVADALLNS